MVMEYGEVLPESDGSTDMDDLMNVGKYNIIDNQVNYYVTVVIIFCVSLITLCYIISEQIIKRIIKTHALA